ncbi:hypothetical protein L596_015146 [Steinernema carpocapsae]|uniref:Uncharacterized protein n=1 Tax=Steinernema carpocapsae TaxID=34508 RepID=A0A4U5NFE2_STECR|nr:hypothetical protein L596_015146 [Steinernema carpocapsae]
MLCFPFSHDEIKDSPSADTHTSPVLGMNTSAAMEACGDVFDELDPKVEILVFSSVTMILILLILFASFCISSDDICVLYTKFLYIGYFPYEALRLIVQIFQFSGLAHVTFLKDCYT